jgi:hypothetical protein
MLTSSLRAVLQVMEAIKPVSREITKETVKTIRAGNAGTCRPTLGGLTRVLSIFRTRGCGCARRARHSLRPLNFEGRDLAKTRVIQAAGMNRRACYLRRNQLRYPPLEGEGRLRM